MKTDFVPDQWDSIFENFDSLSEDLLISFCDKYEIEKINKLKEKSPENYNELNKLYQKMIGSDEEEFTSLDYEDLILIIAKIIKYYTKLNLYLDFTFLEKTAILVATIDPLSANA